MYENQQRMMSWIVNIGEVRKHPNADALEICQVGELLQELVSLKLVIVLCIFPLMHGSHMTLLPFLVKVNLLENIMGLLVKN